MSKAFEVTQAANHFFFMVICEHPIVSFELILFELKFIEKEELNNLGAQTHRFSFILHHFFKQG